MQEGRAWTALEGGRGAEREGKSSWGNEPLHDIAMHYIVWCMVYKRGVGGGGVHCEMGVQKYCNRVGFASGGGNKRMIDSQNKALQ